ncbi:10770_t:CDS:2 [Funneliformis geosporum]|uniref:10770_t:CDS:1 n=1 Tax=Funneliformis geosporum TaxID=1117311 RepID=A0A9W4WHM2_9GLOM|nr:10770_t:CDS:2 [Funneliformis geosporum]
MGSSTGKVVEDALYNFVSKCSYEQYVEGIFTEDEFNEIKAYNSCDLPEILEDLLGYLMTFAS